MTIAIIGATGNFGTDIIDALLARGVEPSNLLALARNGGRLDELADRGLKTAAIDLEDETAATATLRGVDTLLLISIGMPGDGLTPRTAAVNAAKAAGVQQIVYTSALEAPTTSFMLAKEHAATEDVITASGVPATFLRMGWYTDNLRPDFETARTKGVIANSVGDGRLATARRRDMAEAVAVVLTTPGHVGAAYELSGDAAWNYTEFAEAAQDALGTPVRYEVLTPEQEQEALASAGLDDQHAAFMGIINAGIRDDTQAFMNGDLAHLIGRPTTPLLDTLQSWK